MKNHKSVNMLLRLKQTLAEQASGMSGRFAGRIFAALSLSVLMLLPPPEPFRIEYLLGMPVLALGGVWMVYSQISLWRLERPRMQRAGFLLWLLSAFAFGGMQLLRVLLAQSSAEPGIGLILTIPIIVAGLTVAAMLHPIASNSFTTVVSLGAIVATIADWQYAAAAWLATVAGVHGMGQFKDRSDLVHAGRAILIAYSISAILIGFISRYSAIQCFATIGWALVAGVSTVALFWLMVFAFERGSHIVTNWGLLELCSPEHPLLKRLAMEAPGTYQHSIMLANLAEAAAQAIGANSLLTRACAYFHDIGKLNRPAFFVENQTSDNIHCRLSPSLSAMIISEHVKDGLKLADEYKLPLQIRDAIEQHHGTSLISYFYHQVKSDAHDPVLEQYFRYPGPKPRSKEAAIIMLSDIVEAATRSKGKSSPAKLEHFIVQLVEARRQDGQLDESELTMRDLRKIIDVFVHTLTVSRHNRIEYPGVENVVQASNEPNRDYQSIN